jgi:hypothetical protein
MKHFAAIIFALMLGSPAFGADVPVVNNTVIIVTPIPRRHVAQPKPPIIQNVIQPSNPIIMPANDKKGWLGVSNGEWALVFITALIGAGTIWVIQYVQQRDWQRADKEEQRGILRSMMATYRMAQDVRWSEAINMIPLVFRKNDTILGVRKDYVAVASNKPKDDDSYEYKEEYGKKMEQAQILLICEVAKEVGYPVTAAEVKEEGYFSQGMVDREP